MSNQNNGNNQPKPAQSPAVSMTKEELENLLTMSAMASAQAMAAALKGPSASPEVQAQAAADRLQCRECGQLRGACKGKHRQAVVFPRNEERAPFFQGVSINGITYQSQHGGQFITVPEEANVEYMVSQWERQEDILVTGRKASHNSGFIGNAGTNGFVPATGGWR